MEPCTTASLQEPHSNLHRLPRSQVAATALLAHPMETIIVHHPATIDQQPRSIVRGRAEVVVPSALNLQLSLKLRHPVVSEVAIQTRPVATSGAVVDLGNSPVEIGTLPLDRAFGLIRIVETTEALRELDFEACCSRGGLLLRSSSNSAYMATRDD